MHEEYGALESDFVFVNLWKGEIGRPLAYSSVNELVRRTRELIGAVLTHRSRFSTLVCTHLTAEDLCRVLAERGVLDRVADLLT